MDVVDYGALKPRCKEKATLQNIRTDTTMTPAVHATTRRYSQNQEGNSHSSHCAALVYTEDDQGRCACGQPDEVVGCRLAISVFRQEDEYNDLLYIT